jgi:hypothetical protein
MMNEIRQDIETELDQEDWNELKNGQQQRADIITLRLSARLDFLEMDVPHELRAEHVAALARMFAGDQ